MGTSDWRIDLQTMKVGDSAEILNDAPRKAVLTTNETITKVPMSDFTSITDRFKNNYLVEFT